jgi:hypothetical protein
MPSSLVSLLLALLLAAHGEVFLLLTFYCVSLPTEFINETTSRRWLVTLLAEQGVKAYRRLPERSVQPDYLVVL